MDSDKPVRRFIVFTDTNTIWTKEDNVDLMPAAFRDAWEKLAAGGDVELRIPDIVIRELAYQREKYFMKQAQEAHAGLERIKTALALGSPEGANIDRMAMRTAVLAKLRAQINDVLYCSEVDVPYSVLGANMRNIVAASVWRQPPFKEKGESGFRDAVILETVKFAHGVDPHCDIALITKDERLIAAAQDAFKNATNFGQFGSIDDYGKFLELARSRFTPEFLHGVTSKASDVFEKRAWQELDLESLIVKVYQLTPGSTALDDSPREGGALSGLLGLGLRIRECTGDPEWYFITTELLSVVGEDEFHWGSTVLAVTPYADPPPALLSGALETRAEYVRIMQIRIEWAASVSRDQEFSSFRLITERKELEAFIGREESDAITGALPS